MHKRYLVWTARKQVVPVLPMIVVGSLRVGGGGKTPFAAKLAMEYAQQGLRVGLLCHAVHGRLNSTIRIVDPHGDWLETSDEAVWLAQNTKLPVWVTRNRWDAWHQLSQSGGLDLLISDDGLEDPRLAQCKRVILDYGEPASRLRDLIPLGKCRSLRQDHIGVEFLCEVPPPLATVQNSQGQHASGAVIVLCGIGNPKRFVANLEELGLTIRQQVLLKDHSPQVVNSLKSLLATSSDPIVITEKDAIRIPAELLEFPRVFIARQAWLEGVKKVS